MRVDFRLRQKIQDSIVRQRDDFVDFVRRAETIKEVDKRHAAFKRGDMRNQRKILCFLNAAGAEHGAACLTHGHHVGVIAKDGERMGRNGTCGDVQDEGGQLAGEFVQRRDHQQQSL